MLFELKTNVDSSHAPWLACTEIVWIGLTSLCSFCSIPALCPLSPSVLSSQPSLKSLALWPNILQQTHTTAICFKARNLWVNLIVWLSSLNCSKVHLPVYKKIKSGTLLTATKCYYTYGYICINNYNYNSPVSCPSLSYWRCLPSFKERGKCEGRKGPDCGITQT